MKTFIQKRISVGISASQGFRVNRKEYLSGYQGRLLCVVRMINAQCIKDYVWVCFHGLNKQFCVELIMFIMM